MNIKNNQKKNNIRIIKDYPTTIKVSNEILNNTFKLSLLEHKILILALAKVETNKQNNLITSEINIAELKNITGITGNSIYEQVKKSIINLSTFYYLKKEYDNNRFLIHGLFDNIKYNEGIIYFNFNNMYSSLIFDIEYNYTIIDLDIIMKFESVYSLKLYEILKTLKRHNVITIKEMSINEIKLLLGMVKVNDKMREELNNNPSINKNILVEKYADENPSWTSLKRTFNKAIKEINKKSDINVIYEQIRTGKGGRISKIVFAITSNNIN